MVKSKKRLQPKKREALDVARIESLVCRLLNEDYRMPLYRPDNIDDLPWDQIVESFYAGYNFGLDAVLKALNGDGGQGLQEILDGRVTIIRAEDRVEYEKRRGEGVVPFNFCSRRDAEDFEQFIGKFDDEAMPPESLN